MQNLKVLYTRSGYPVFAKLIKNQNYISIYKCVLNMEDVLIKGKGSYIAVSESGEVGPLTKTQENAKIRLANIIDSKSDKKPKKQNDVKINSDLLQGCFTNVSGAKIVIGNDGRAYEVKESVVKPEFTVFETIRPQLKDKKPEPAEYVAVTESGIISDLFIYSSLAAQNIKSRMLQHTL